MRWAVLAAAIVGTFVVSVAAGAFAARLINGRPTTPPVAVASPMATPAAQQTPTSTSPQPATPTATYPATPTPTSPPPATPTPAPEPTPTPQPVLDPPTAEEFADDLAMAITGGDDEYLLARLHPEVITRYGTEACEAHIVANVSGDPTGWEIQDSSGPHEWDYASDEQSVTITDAWFVNVQVPGEADLSELHFAPAEGTWRWFTDCGEPA